MVSFDVAAVQGCPVPINIAPGVSMSLKRLQDVPLRTVHAPTS